MHFLDPSRPGAPDQPQYVDTEGSPLAALQDLLVFPQAEGFRASVMLRVGRNEYKWFHHQCRDASAVGALVLAYVMDPEETLTQAFGYSRAIPKTTPKPSKTKLTLQDLGLS